MDAQAAIRHKRSARFASSALAVIRGQNHLADLTPGIQTTSGTFSFVDYVAPKAPSAK
jgi:hypothetical protein